MTPDRPKAADQGNARATVVNRTHRIIRDQAVQMQQKRQRSRSLWVPLFICSALLLVIGYAIWGVMDGYDLTPTGVPDASDQMFLLLLWSLPVTVVVLGMVWLRKRKSSGSGEQAL